MKRKYFFFDIDGTLGLKLTKQLPADTAYCLKRLVQKGQTSEWIINPYSRADWL